MLPAEKRAMKRNKRNAETNKGMLAYKMEKVMHEFKHGELKSSSGGKVNSRKQAIAIAYSEARKRANG